MTSMTRRTLTGGDIGEDQREYEFEPIADPGVPEPVVVPEPSREPVAVPA